MLRFALWVYESESFQQVFPISLDHSVLHMDFFRFPHLFLRIQNIRKKNLQMWRLYENFIDS